MSSHHTRECPACGTSFPDGVDACPHDGTRLVALQSEPASKMLCPLCGNQYPAGTQKCERDGAVLIELQADVSLIGELLKNTYRVEAKVDAGGMGVVYRGTQQPLGRSVAIKTLLPGMERDSALVKRFFREAQLLSELNHPNVVQVFDCGNTNSGIFFLVMEFMDGEPLQKKVRKGEGLPIEDAVDLFGQICEGVAEAHRQGLVHRDLKPSNVFILTDHNGHLRAKVFDFGLARRVDGNNTQITQAGMVMGTPGYVAPEQLTGEQEPDARCDIYALGAILFFLLTGRSAYRGKTAHSVVAKQLSEGPAMEELARDAIPGVMGEIILKAMSRQPDDRYQTVEDLASAVANHDATVVEALAYRESIPPTQVLDEPDADEPKAAGESAAQADAGSGLGRRGLIWGALGLGMLGGGAFGVFKLGESESSPEVRMPDAATPTPVVDTSPIRFGMSAPFTGPSRDLGTELRAGIKAGFQAINAAGGIGGRPLELLARDDGYEPDQARANVQGFIDDGNILGLVGCVGTPTARVTLPMAVQARMPFIGAFSGAKILREMPPARYVINYRASYEQETAAMVHYFLSIRQIEPDRIAVFSQADSYGDAGMDGVVSALRRAGYRDTDDVLHVRYERNSVNVSEAVEGIWNRRRRIDAVVMVGTYRPCARFIHELKRRGADFIFANVSFVGSRSLAEELNEFEAGCAEGVLVTQVVPHPESQATGVMHYREVLGRFQGQERPGFVSLEGYIVSMMLKEALERATAIEGEALIDAFEGIRDLDLGIGTILSFGPSDHQGSNKVWGTQMSADGSFEVIRLD